MTNNMLKTRRMMVGNPTMTGKRLVNDSRTARKWLDPILSRFCLASLICLCMLTISIGNAWGTVPSGWTQVTALNGIAAGDKIIIVTNDGSNYLNGTVASGHFSSSALSASAPASASAAGVILLESTGTANRYKLKLVSANKYITATAASSGNGSVSANSDSYGWTFSVSSSKFNARYQETNKQAYLRSYNDDQFRTYSSTSSGKTFIIYKYSPTPTLTVSKSSITTGLTYESGSGPSAAQTFTVSGTNMSANVTVSAPTNFEVSTDGSSYAASKTITASGTLSATTVYVRLKSDLAVNSYSGDITVSSTGATSKTVSLSGSVTCSNYVTISKGTGTNCTFTLSKSGEQASCDGVSTIVTVTPTTGYGTPVVTESGASASITGSGNSQTVTYAANTTGTSTIAVSCSANNYTIHLDNEGATTAGTTSITATYDDNNNLDGTPAITVPDKTGWTFGGYYTSKQGGGSQIIDASGNVNESVSNYTDDSKNWIKPSDVTLYAKWTCTVTWSVNGSTSVYSSEEITYNSSGCKVSNVPTPDPDDYCGDKFMGWSAKNAGVEAKTDSYYDDLFETVSASPNITGDITFYAVFADYDE